MCLLYASPIKLLSYCLGVMDWGVARPTSQRQNEVDKYRLSGFLTFARYFHLHWPRDILRRRRCQPQP